MKNHSNKATDTTVTTDKKMHGRETGESTLLPVRELRNMQRALFSLYANEPEPLFVNGRYLYVQCFVNSTISPGMKADNSQIARAVFFKLYHTNRDKEACGRAALRLAAAILNGSLTLGLGDTDHIIETELEKFGCRFLIGRGGTGASFNLNGQTEIEAAHRTELTKEIYG